MATTSFCGECAMLEGERVAIVDGKCPRCEERRSVVAFARQDAAMVAGFRKDHPGLLRDPNICGTCGHAANAVFVRWAQCDDPYHTK